MLVARSADAVLDIHDGNPVRDSHHQAAQHRCRWRCVSRKRSQRNRNRRRRRGEGHTPSQRAPKRKRRAPETQVHIPSRYIPGLFSAMALAAAGYLAFEWPGLLAGGVIYVACTYAAAARHLRHIRHDEAFEGWQRHQDISNLAVLAAEFAAACDVPPPRVFTHGTSLDIAAVTPVRRHGALVANERLLARLDDDELRAVVAHEIAHIEDNALLERLAWAPFAAAVHAASVVATVAVLPGAWKLLALLPYFLVGAAAGRAVTHDEYQADRRSVELTGGDPGPLISALRKVAAMYAAEREMAVEKWIQRHPDLPERLERLAALRPDSAGVDEHHR